MYHYGISPSERRVKCLIEDKNLSLRRGSSVLIGGAFEQRFCPKGRQQAKLQKFKFPGRGGMLNFRIDRRITRR